MNIIKNSNMINYQKFSNDSKKTMLKFFRVTYKSSIYSCKGINKSLSKCFRKFYIKRRMLLRLNLKDALFNHRIPRIFFYD